MNIHIDDNGIVLCHLLRLLEKYGLLHANTVSTPLDCNSKLVKDDDSSKLADPSKYQSMVVIAYCMLPERHVMISHTQLELCQNSTLHQLNYTWRQ